MPIEWVSIAFMGVIVRGRALDNYPGGAKQFAEDHGARTDGFIVVSCSMGGDNYLNEVVDAAKEAGADPNYDIAYLEAASDGMYARAMGRTPRNRGIAMQVPWLRARVRDGVTEVRLGPLYSSRETAAGGPVYLTKDGRKMTEGM